MELSCHCGNIKIDVNKPEKVTRCNCSICSRYMSLWGYYSPEQPKISIGSYGTDSYSWGDKELDFVRCANCGCVTHYQTKAGQSDPRVAINFGMARGYVTDVPIRYFNGAEEL
jgi:hypothetical protein